MLADLVVGTVAVHTANGRATTDSARVIAVVLNDVVFGQRVVDPAVDRQVRRRAAGVLAAKVDDPVCGASGPTKPDNEVWRIIPLSVNVAATLVV